MPATDHKRINKEGIMSWGEMVRCMNKVLPETKALVAGEE